ncbi:MAG: FAD-dependent oxidoreductase, partial [Pseudomonadales bacterium]
MKIDTEDVVIVGAGIIGLACGYRLLQEGRSVLWVDPKSPGSGASYGNAGTIADYAVMPVGSPSVLKRLPQLLFDSESPLSMQPGALAMLAPWLAKFAYQSLPGPMAKNMRAIAALVLDAGSRWQELARAIAVEDHFKNEGCLYVYRDA